MNIKNIGIDIIENQRFEDKLTNTNFIERILSNNELLEFKDITNEKRKIEFLASRFAAKEAFSKALGHYDGHTNFSDIEVSHEKDGRPFIIFLKDKTIKSLLSISHSDNYSVAQCIIVE